MTDVELSPGGVGFIRVAAVKPNIPTSPARAAWAKGQAVEDVSEGRVSEMTGERERLLAVLFDTGMFEIGTEWKRRIIADAILAAGFGDVAGAKADALESAVEALEVDRREGSTFLRVVPVDAADRVSRHAGRWLRARANEYRTADATPLADGDPARDMTTRRAGCNCFMWDEGCPEHAKNTTKEGSK